MERIFAIGARSRLRLSFGNSPLFSEPFVINRNSRVVSSSRISVTPIDTSNIKSFDIAKNQVSNNNLIPASSSQTVGDFVTDTRIVTFINPRRLFIHMNSMRPASDIFVFFDRTDVTSLCTPANVSTVAGATIQRNDFSVAGAKGSQLTVNSTGDLYFLLDIPAGTFFSGDREIIATDVSDLNSISSSSTKASFIYYAFNFSPRPGAIRPIPNPPRRVISRGGPRMRFESDDFDPNRWRDPISQTFFVSAGLAKGTEGFYASKVDIYFENKSSTLGVSVELREVINGFPTGTSLPFSNKHLPSSAVSTSSNSAAATTFIFDSPVFLAAGAEYALVIIPDASNPDYRVWTSETGGIDVLTSNSVTTNWGEGTLFFSTNGSAWTPVQGEDLKFTLYRSKFNSNTGQAVFVNDDYEFITLSAVTGTPIAGEQVFNSSGPVLPTAGTSGILTTGSDILTGVATNFTNEISAGAAIAVSNGTLSVIRKVKSITSTTALVMDGPATFSGSALSIYKAITGDIDVINASSLSLVLNNSNSVPGSLFSATDVLKTESGDSLTISSIDNKSISSFQPFSPRQVLNGSNLVFNRSGVYATGQTFTDSLVELGTTNNENFKEMIVKSKSNEAGVKSFTYKGNFSIDYEVDGVTLKDTISPSIDEAGVSLSTHLNLINNDSTNEFSFNNGNAIVKYISKRVVLQDQMDAEDVNVILTGYRPFDTEIKVFVKVLNSSDSEDFDSKNWSLLTQKSDSISLFSDSNNLNDYKEYSYQFPDKPVSTPLAGMVGVTNGSATVNGAGTLFNTDLAVGDAVLIMADTLSNNYQVSRVATRANDTTLVLEDVITLPTTTDASIEKVEDPKTGFKNPQNSNIVRYFGESGAAFDTFKMYAVKIVMLSPTNYIVPKIKDLRVISLSV